MVGRPSFEQASIGQAKGCAQVFPQFLWEKHLRFGEIGQSREQEGRAKEDAHAAWKQFMRNGTLFFFAC